MKNILIVEDEANVRESLRNWLIELGCHVEVTSDGEEALTRISEKEFDLVILDLRLPGKDGLQVLREARLKKPQAERHHFNCLPHRGNHGRSSGNRGC